MARRNLQTSVAGVWAAGDICTVRPEEKEPCWFQMRLWTQVHLQPGHLAIYPVLIYHACFFTHHVHALHGLISFQ